MVAYISMFVLLLLEYGYKWNIFRLCVDDREAIWSFKVKLSSHFREWSLFRGGGGGGNEYKLMFLLEKILLTQPLKSQHFFLPNLRYQLENKYPPVAKNVTKGYRSVVTHVLYHFCDTSLITHALTLPQSLVTF